MRILITIFLVLTLVFSCKKQAEQETVSDQGVQEFSFRDMPKTVVINPEAQQILDNWAEYQALVSSFSVLKRAANTEDLKLAIDDLIEKEIALAKADYPDPFDQLQIKSRQRVLRTFLLKVKGNLQDRRDVQEAMKQMMVAYNALNEQFNRITSATLDKSILLEDEE